MISRVLILDIPGHICSNWGQLVPSEPRRKQSRTARGFSLTKSSTAIPITAPVARLARELESISGQGLGDRKFIQSAEPALRRLLAGEDFLPAEATRPSAKSYARHLLHADPEDRFCLAAMVWAPGQGTPIHDHDGTWGMIGMIQGSLEVVDFFSAGAEIASGELALRSEPPHVPRADSSGCVCGCADIHSVNNPFGETAISLHVYARELERCHVFDPISEKDGRYMVSEKTLTYTDNPSS